MPSLGKQVFQAIKEATERGASHSEIVSHLRDMGSGKYSRQYMSMVRAKGVPVPEGKPGRPKGPDKGPGKRELGRMQKAEREANRPPAKMGRPRSEHTLTAERHLEEGLSNKIIEEKTGLSNAHVNKLRTMFNKKQPVGRRRSSLGYSYAGLGAAGLASMFAGGGDRNA